MAKTRKNNASMRKTRKNNASMRKTRKQFGGKRALSPWNKFVTRVFNEMKKANKDTQFKDALKEASKRKKNGEMK